MLDLFRTLVFPLISSTIEPRFTETIFSQVLLNWPWQLELLCWFMKRSQPLLYSLCMQWTVFRRRAPLTTTLCYNFVTIVLGDIDVRKLGWIFHHKGLLNVVENKNSYHVIFSNIPLKRVLQLGRRLPLPLQTNNQSLSLMHACSQDKMS